MSYRFRKNLKNCVTTLFAFAILQLFWFLLLSLVVGKVELNAFVVIVMSICLLSLYKLNEVLYVKVFFKLRHNSYFQMIFLITSISFFAWALWMF